MKRILWMVGLLGLFCVACGGGDDSGGSDATVGQPRNADGGDLPAAVDIGEKLASINGMDVGTNDFDRIAKRMRPRAGTVDDEFKQEVVDELVNESLLYQEALRQGIDQDPKIRKMMVNTLLKRDVYGTLDPKEITEDELRAYFEEHKEDFVVPEKVQIKRILIKVSDVVGKEEARGQAEELRAQIEENPKQFKVLAQEHSQGPYARRGGDLGFVGVKGKPGVDQEIIDTAFEMEKGDISEVLETDGGFSVLYIPNKRDRVERTFEQMRGSVLRKVKSDRYNQLYDSYVGNLKTDADVRVDEAAVGAYEYKVEKRGGSAPGAGGRVAPPSGAGGAADAPRVAPPTATK